MGSARLFLPKTYYMSRTPTTEPGYETSEWDITVAQQKWHIDLCYRNTVKIL